MSRQLAFLAVLSALLALPLVLTPGASALDLCEEARCQPPPAEQNSPYEFKFVAEEGCVPYTFSYLNGTVPPGLTITSDGRLTGTPTQAGDFEFWVALDDNGGPQNPGCPFKSRQSQAQFFLHVMPDLYVATTSLAPAVAGKPYSATLEAANEEAGWPVVWDVTQGSLPAGLSLSASGVISGTPTGADSKTVTVRVREPFRRSGERQLTVVVAAALSASSSASHIGEVGVRYSGKVGARGGTSPYTWSVTGGALPNGLALDPASGQIRGVPTSSGSFSAQLGVRDASGQTATVVVNVRVASRLTIRTVRLPGAAVGSPYQAKLVSAGGIVPRRWALVRGTFPRGVRLDSSRGVLSGVPRTSGVYKVSVRVTDRLGASATRALRLVVKG
jgi:hypothetical protein